MKDSKYLTCRDHIISIRKNFFPRRFGMEITNDEEIYELNKKNVSLGSKRQLGSIPDSILPIGDEFDLNIEEGPIRKLTRF